MKEAHANVSTGRAQRYLDQVCTHFGNSGSTRIAGNRGVVDFEDGTLTAVATPEALLLAVQAEEPEALTRLKDVVKSHLERWGERDAIRVDWDARPPA